MSRPAVVVDVCHGGCRVLHLAGHGYLAEQCDFHLVVHDGVDKDGDAVLGQDLQVYMQEFINFLWLDGHPDLLRWDIIGLGSHVNLLIVVDAGDDEEDART